MTIRKLLIATAAAAALQAPTPIHADRQPNVLDLKNSLTDSSVVFPESFETDTQKMLEGWYMKNYTATDRRYEEMEDADTSDETIIERLKALPTVIEMPFNEVVRTYIDRYTKRGRSQVAALLGMSLYYLPVFEQALEERGLPLELKYLPVIESGLDPNAVSRHGATGLWQFMLGTARGLGMEVNSLVDERRDPYVASERAATYLKDLYDTYGDWSLAIAAYNCGPGNVNKALRRAGGDPKSHDFWGIYYYLSPETRGYVPMFIAANYVMNYYQDHNISPVLAVKPLVTDTLHITERVHFNQISKVLDIPVEELRILNPQFRADLIPGTPDTPYTLILPSQQIHAYLMSEDAIKEYESDRYALRGVVEPGEVPSDAMLAVDEETFGEEAFNQELDDVALAAGGGRGDGPQGGARRVAGLDSPEVWRERRPDQEDQQPAAECGEGRPAAQDLRHGARAHRGSAGPRAPDGRPRRRGGPGSAAEQGLGLEGRETEQEEQETEGREAYDSQNQERRVAEHDLEEIRRERGGAQEGQRHERRQPARRQDAEDSREGLYGVEIEVRLEVEEQVEEEKEKTPLSRDFKNRELKFACMDFFD